MSEYMHTEDMTTANPTTGIHTEPRGAVLKQVLGEWQQRRGIVDEMTDQ
jgi:hypothetical protein